MRSYARTKGDGDALVTLPLTCSMLEPSEPSAVHWAVGVGWGHREHRMLTLTPSNLTLRSCRASLYCNPCLGCVSNGRRSRPPLCLAAGTASQALLPQERSGRGGAGTHRDLVILGGR